MKKFFTKRLRAKTLRSYAINIDGIEITVAHKKIRALRIGINGRNSKVRASAPEKVSEAKVKSFIISKIDWIKKHLVRIESKPPKLQQQILDGEVHYFFGKPYVVGLVELQGRNKIEKNQTLGDSTLIFTIKPNSSLKQREKLLQNFYRKELQIIIPELVEKWETFLKVKSSGFAIRNMKSRWGTCNITTRNITLSLELAKKPIVCLEYVVVHELVHLIERRHNKRFYTIVERCLPDWKERKKLMAGTVD